MATRMIVTSMPDVVCDVCGRRLLRGEQPDVFLASGRRRTVCKLCAPRATHEGWLRETDRHSVSLPPGRPRRGRNLLGRLRQLREPAPPQSQSQPADEALLSPPVSPAEDLMPAGSYDPLEDLPVLAEEPLVAGISAAAGVALEPAPTGGDVKVQRALEVFNAGEHPRRVAGVARSLGAPSVTVRPLAESGSAVTIVIAWELSWYRYEVDLGDEAAGVSVVAQGTELGELAAEDRLANASAAADGALSLVG